VLVRVRRAPAGLPSTGTAGDRPLLFWRKGGELWALAGLPIETPPGGVPIAVAWRSQAMAAALEVVEPRFPARTLSVSPRFVEPPESVKLRIASDQEAFAAAYARPFVPPLFAASFGWPRKARTNGRYGDQRVFNGKKESVHYGLDIAGPRGATVRASNDGQVVLVRDCYYSGKTVVIWHGADVFTLYFHLDRMAVRPGAKVRKGDRVGAIGSTGRSTGPHLHWSARVAGLLVDPESLLGIDFARGTAPPRRAGPRAPPPPKDVPAPVPPPEAAPPEAPAGPPPAGVATVPAPPR
jgi:murein DD-endopeptidase MepM/ murein hydrolase activator NlpD